MRAPDMALNAALAEARSLKAAAKAQAEERIAGMYRRGSTIEDISRAVRKQPETVTAILERLGMHARKTKATK